MKVGKSPIVETLPKNSACIKLQTKAWITPVINYLTPPWLPCPIIESDLQTFPLAIQDLLPIFLERVVILHS